MSEFVTPQAYALLLNSQDSFAKALFSYILIAFSVVLLGFNIGHDAVHNAYSDKKMVNKILGYSFDFVGNSSYAWNITHNIIHHTFTNIVQVDNDINNTPVFRYSKTEKLCWHNKFQHFYAPFVYSLVGFLRLVLDVLVIYNYSKIHPVKTKDWVLAIFFKVLNLAVFLVIPILVLPLIWWKIVLAYSINILLIGFLFAIVVSLGHVVDNATMLEMDKGSDQVDMHWAVHEMLTTSNFANDNPVLTFLLGGLNFQIEHHLFPYVCHVHYPKIKKFVQDTAQEFNIPYHENLTFGQALRSHFRLLKKGGHLLVDDAISPDR